MNILEGLVKSNINPTLNMDMSTDKTVTHNTHINKYYDFSKLGTPLITVALLLCATWLVVTGNLSCQSSTNSVPAPATFESQVRQWASDYPADLRDRWAWCYLDSVANFSTEQKLREDVRLKSVQVLTDSQREVLAPLDRKIADAVPKQKTELVETYHAVGMGLKVTPWTPVGDGSRDPPTPQPPERRRLIFRR